MKRPAWGVVPAKSLVSGKSRLRAALGDTERALFARRLLEHVLDVLGGCGLDGVLVATNGDDVASLAAARGAVVLHDRGSGTLAEVVDSALGEVAARGALAAVVTMADLPLVRPADVVELIGMLDRHDVVIVRDHLGRHTNALAVSPPTAFATCFGCDDSFAAHLAAARAAGLRAAVVSNDRIAFDVDVPADHDALTATRPGAETGNARRA